MSFWTKVLTWNVSFIDELSHHDLIWKNIFDFNFSRPDPGRKEKINLNFYFHACKLVFILIQLSEIHRGGGVNNSAANML